MARPRSRKNPVTVRGPWFALSLEMIRSRAFAELSPHAAKLFLDLCAQLGPNSLRNGDLTATPGVMRARGWTSEPTLKAAVQELLNAGLLILSRQGNKRRCSLYALTPWPLDCDLSKIDITQNAYQCADWTKGLRDRSDPPTTDRPAKWNRARKNAIRTPVAGGMAPVIHPPRKETELACDGFTAATGE